MKNLVVYSLMALLILFLISCEGDNDKIPTITMELVESSFEKSLHMGPGKVVSFTKWYLVADPVPTKDLVVIVGARNRPDDWYDYGRESFIHGEFGVRNRYRPPFYVVISKFEERSQIFKSHNDIAPLYINPLPSVSIVGKGIEIDTDTLSKTLPATTYGGHIIPKEHKFVPYRVGNLYGISKRGNPINKETKN